MSYTDKVQVMGWPAVIEEMGSTSKFKKDNGSLPYSLDGLIRLYPKREDRYIWNKDFDWVELDVYFREYGDKLIESLMKFPLGTPLIIYGEIKYRVNKFGDYEDYPFEIDIAHVEEDPSKGKISMARASLHCSSKKELSSL